MFRGVISLVFCVYYLRKHGRDLFGKNKKVLIMRGFFGTLALLSLFICIQKIPLAVAVTLANLAPIFTVLIAHLFIGEKGSFAQWIFLLLAFAGVYMVRGHTAPVPWEWMLLGIASALFSAIAYTCVRHLRLSEDPLVVVLYFPLITIPMMGPIMVYEWQTPQGIDWLVLIAIGVLTQIAQYYMTLAYQMETAAKVMIFNYIGLVWGVIFGWILFGEKLSKEQLLGVFVVFLCLSGNWYFSNVKKPRAPAQRSVP